MNESLDTSIDSSLSNSSNSENNSVQNISLIPSSYYKIDSLEVENPPLLPENSSSNNKSKKEKTKETFSIIYQILDKLFINYLFSTLAFNWTKDIILKRKKKRLKLSSLGNVPSYFTGKFFYSKIMPKWRGKYQYVSIKNKNDGIQNCYPLFMTIISANIKRLLLTILLSILSSACDFFGILVFQEVIKRFKKDNNYNDLSWLLRNLSLTQLVFLMILYQFLLIILFNQLLFITDLLKHCIIAQLNLLIYDKLLKTATFDKNFNEGQIINLLQIDCATFGNFVSKSTRSLALPFTIIYSIYLLFNYFGLSFIPGFIVLIILAYITLKLGKKDRKLQKEKMVASDARMDVISQTINIIKMIKLYTWEKIFLKKIGEKRKKELKICGAKVRLNIWIDTIYWNVTNIFFMICIVFYNIFYHQMETDKIFTSLYIIQGLVGQLMDVPNLLTCFSDAIISLTRIEDFLSNKNYDTSQLYYLPNKKKSPYAIEISQVTFGVEKSYKTDFENDKKNKNKKSNYIPLEDAEHLNNNLVDEENIIYEKGVKKIILLKDIDIHIIKQEHVGIIGEVGSGKTSLLYAFINNLEIINKGETKNNIIVSGKMSFVGQNPWILNGTVENNILLFNKRDEIKYKKIVSICQLEEDFKEFPNGDKTEIGEKGINLSGGQKVRIAIARAIYNDAEIFIFDDPLSSLDAYVGMNLFKEVFNHYLKNKTVIISTNALQYISHFDRIIYMKQGKINWVGTYVEIIHEQFYEEFVKNAEAFRRRKSSKKRKNSDIKQENETENDEERYDEPSTSQLKIIPQEEIEEIKDKDIDKISCSSFCGFLRFSGGTFQFIKIIIVNIIWRSCEICSDYYLTSWSSVQNISTKENNKRLFIFVLISLPSVLLVYFRQTFVSQSSANYVIKMHEVLINKLLSAPINLFHDITPKGHIINRLGKDLGNGAELSNVMSSTLRVGFQLLGSILVCLFFNIWTLPIIIIIIFIETFITIICLKPIRDMSRLEGLYRTPIFSVFTETLYGLHEIRAFQYEEKFTDKFYNKMDDYLKICVYQNGITGWYSVRLDIISYLLLVFILIFSCIFKKYYNSQSIGLMLSYSINMIDYLFDFMENFGKLSELLVSVERCENYTKIPQEKYPILETDKYLPLLPSRDYECGNFISNGDIKFVDYSMRYRPGHPLVLKNLTFEIKPKEKIGVVGRTGSGKSSLCLSIFRLIEADSGKIIIDNIDISKIGLEMLRKNLTIIPQEPTLIEGNLRENIDPTNSYTDEEINNIIKEVGLDDFMFDKNLEYIITDNGSNLSIGEKQLICIARALLKRSKIIVMDEATANVDFKTETVLQNSINQGMKNCTVITIAHRIKTIINYDKILVLDHGEMVEFDSPKNLIAKKGLFYQLYKESTLHK